VVILAGAVSLWIGGSARVALANESEELFLPYQVASLAQPGQERIPGNGSGERMVIHGETVDPNAAAKGVQLVKQREYSKAIAVLEPLRSQPDFLVLHALGVAYVRTRRNAEAYDVLRRAHELRPNVPGPLLPAALACARMAPRCHDYRELALEYIQLGGRFKKLAEKIANHQPLALMMFRRP
jgi:tetratricopeptide (TPR) repeat protein